MRDAQLVKMNGDLITTFKRGELEDVTVACLIEDFEQGMARGVPSAEFDELYVFTERFSLVIRNEVMERNDSRFVTDYFDDGEEPIRITLVKQPVDEAGYNNLRRQAKLEREWERR